MNLNAIQPTRLVKDAAKLANAPSVLPTATNLLTFMGQRYVATYSILQCQNLTNVASRVSVQVNDQGVANVVLVDGKAIPIPPQ